MLTRLKCLQNISKKNWLPGVCLVVACIVFLPALGRAQYYICGTCSCSPYGSASLCASNSFPDQPNCQANIPNASCIGYLSDGTQVSCTFGGGSCTTSPGPFTAPVFNVPGGGGSDASLGGDGITTGAGGLSNDFGSTRLTGPEQGQASFTSHPTRANKQWMEEAMSRQTAIAPLRDTPAPKTTLNYERNYLKKTNPKAPCAGVSGPCIGSLDAKPSLLGKKEPPVKKSPGDLRVKEPPAPVPAKKETSPQTCSSKWACAVTKLSDFSQTPEYEGMAAAGEAIVSALEKAGPVGKGFAFAGNVSKEVIEIGLKATEAQTRDELSRNDQLNRIKKAQESCKTRGDMSCVRKLGDYANDIRNKEGYNSGASFIFSGVRKNAAGLAADYVVDKAVDKLADKMIPEVDAPIGMQNALKDGKNILAGIGASVVKKATEGEIKEQIKKKPVGESSQGSEQ